MSHVEHLVHLLPVGAALIVNCSEKRWDGEHVVLDDTAVVANKVKNLCLSSTCAVYHSMDVAAHLVEYLLDDRSISASGGEDKLACIDGSTINRLVESVGTAIYQFVGHGMIIGLGIFLGKIFRENIVTG